MHERLNSYAEFLDQPHVRETGLIQWLTQAGLNRPVPVPALPGMLPQLDGTPRAHGAGHRPAHRRCPGRARLQRGRDRGPAGARHGRGRMTTAPKKAVVVGALGVIGRYIVDRLLASPDMIALITPSIPPVPPHAVEERRRRHRRHRRARARSGASAARRSRRPVRSPTTPASTACRCWSPAAASCWRRRTARSTCARRSGRCASPARRRS